MLQDHLELQTFELKELSDEKLVTVAPQTLLTDTIALMSQESVSCVLIEQQSALQGIFTERDLVKLTASGAEISEIAIAEVMTKQPITISTSENLNLVELISLLNKQGIRHLPLVDSTGQIFGIITHRSLRKAFKATYLLKQKQIKEVMNRQVICTTSDRSIFQIADLLATHQVSCVLIVEAEGDDQQYPKGIFTERDLVNFRVLGLNLYQIPVQEVMSSPLFPIIPDASLWDAHQLMQQHHIRRLVVTNQDGTLAGIITQTTILQALDRDDLYQCLTELEQVVKEKTEQLEIKIAEQKLLEQRLQISQSQLRSILAGITDIILILDEQGRDIQVLSMDAAITYPHKQELVTKTLEQFWQPETAQKFLSQVRQVIQTQKMVDFEYSINLEERQPRTTVGQFWFTAQINPMSPDSVIWIARDITQRKSAEIALQNAKVELEDQVWQRTQELKIANRLLQQQINRFFKGNRTITAESKGISSLVSIYLGKLKKKIVGVLDNLHHDKFPVWTGGAIAAVIALTIEILRQSGIIVPVPFMLLIITVTLASSLGGIIAGLWGILVWAIFVIYAASVPFGPKTLTGGILQVTIGILVLSIVALIEGWTKEKNRKLTGILKFVNHNLEREVTQRTQQISTVNTSLKKEIRDRIASQRALKESEQKYRLAALISSRFINLAAEEIDLGIERALQEIGEFINVESSFVFLSDPEQQSFSMTHEWVATGIASAKEKCQNLSVQMYPWGWEQIRQGKLVCVPSLDSLPPEAAVDRSSFQKAQVKSVVDIPLSIAERVFGWVGFASYTEEKNWSQDWISLLKIVGEIFTNALQRQQSERALKLSQQKFQAIFNQTFQLIGLLNPEGIALEVNQTALDFAGLKLEDVIGKPAWETYWWQISSATQLQLQQAVVRAAKGEFIRYEVDIWGKNKQVITIDFSLKPITDENGKVILLIPEGRDISDRVKAEAKLKASEAKFRAIFEQAAVGIAHTGLDKKFLRVNQKFADIVGYSPQDLQHLSFDQITYPADRASDKKHVQQLIRGEISTLVTEKRYVRKDGSSVWVKLTTAPVYDADNKPEYFISVIEDISQRKAAELALEESETRFFSMFNSFPYLVWISGNDGLCTFFNHAWLDFTGKNIEQELGYGWSEGVHPDDLQYCLDIYQSAFKQHQNFQMEYRLRRFDGEYRWLLAEGMPRFKLDSDFAGYIGTCIDITELKRAREIKKDAENKALMLKEIHHRIKNNLQIVSALLDLQSGQTKNLEIIDLLEKSQARIHTMGLIHEKLYSSATLDKINFLDYIESLTRYLQTSFIPDDEEIAIILDIEPIYLNIDSAIPCGLIINELVINALQHSFLSQQAGEIKISFSQLSPDYFCLTVQDNGIGIRENIDLENIQSLGSLGLSLVNSLATMQLEGTLKIYRVNGTLFKIEFPHLK